MAKKPVPRKKQGKVIALFPEAAFGPALNSVGIGQALEKLGTLYEERKYDTEPPCPKCKERLAKVKEEGSPTPFALAHRLNAVSERFSRYLIGKRGHPVIYTSNWGKGAHLEGMHMVSSNSPIPLEE